MERVLQFLERFRRTIIFLLVLFVLLVAICYPLSKWMIADLSSLLPGQLYQTMVAEALWSRLMLCLAVSAVITIVSVAFCILKELKTKRASGLVLLGASLFVGGAAFSRYLVLPPAILMLSGVLAGNYYLHITMSDYVSFCLLFLLIIGLLFEEPLLVYLLYKMGLVTGDALRKRRKSVYLVTLILLAILTPTQDAVTLVLEMLPFIGLYESSVAWLWLLGRRKATRVPADG